MGSTEEVVDVYADKHVRVQVHVRGGLVFFEGGADALEFLGKLFLARSKADADDCAYWISPKNPGSAFFDPKAALGIYIHRLPCGERHPERARERGQTRSIR